MADDDEEWRFSVDEVGPDDPDEDGSDESEDAESATRDGRDERGADDDGWSVTMVGEDDDGPTVGIATGEGESESEEGDGAGVAGELVPESPVEPGTPDPENVVFTAAGAIVAALVFAAVLDQLDPVTAGAIAAAIAGAAGLLYVFFRRVGTSES